MTSDLTPETAPGPEHWLGGVWLILVRSSGLSEGFSVSHVCFHALVITDCDLLYYLSICVSFPSRGPVVPGRNKDGGFSPLWCSSAPVSQSCL